MASPNLNNLVVPPVQSMRSVVDPLSVVHPSVPLPSGHIELTNVRNRLVHYHERPRGKLDSKYLSLRRAQQKYTGRTSLIRLDIQCIVYVIYQLGSNDHMYVGLTHNTALGRFYEHIQAAVQYGRRPPGGRNVHNTAHMMYRIWLATGLESWAIYPVEIVMADARLCTPKVFAKRYAGREAFWMDNRKTLHPRGYNVRNGKPLKQLANIKKHRRQKEHSRALATSRQPPTTSSLPTLLPPPPSLGSHGTLAMTGHLRNSSYARTAHALLTKICAWTSPIPEILTPDHHIVSYLSEMTNNTLNKMVYVLTNFTLEQMNMLRPMTLNVDDNVQLYLTPAWSALVRRPYATDCQGNHCPC